MSVCEYGPYGSKLSGLPFRDNSSGSLTALEIHHNSFITG